MHVVNKREHDKNQQHKTKYVHNGVRLGGTTSLSPDVNVVQATALSVGKSDDVHACVYSIIKGIFPHVGVAPRYVPLQELKQEHMDLANNVIVCSHVVAKRDEFH